MCYRYSAFFGSVTERATDCENECNDGDYNTACGSTSLSAYWLQAGLGADYGSVVRQITNATNPQVMRGCFPSSVLVDSSNGAYVLTVTITSVVAQRVWFMMESGCSSISVPWVYDLCSNYDFVNGGRLFDLAAGQITLVQLFSNVKCFDVVADTISEFRLNDVVFSVLSETVVSHASPPPLMPAPPPSPPGFVLETWVIYLISAGGVVLLVLVSVIVAKFNPRAGALLLDVVATTFSVLRGQLPDNVNVPLRPQSTSQSQSQPPSDARLMEGVKQKVVDALSSTFQSNIENPSRSTVKAIPIRLTQT